MDRRLALSALSAPFAALLAAPAKTLASGDPTAMDDALPLFAIVDRLVDARPLTATATGKLVGGALAPNGTRSTEHVLIYEARGLADFSRVELRLQGPKSADDGQFLLLDVDAKRCIGTDAVQGRYGRQPELSVPTPRQPPDSPVYLKYRHDWGTLSFGFARTDAECLVQVVLDVAASK
jgi:hypothetical protein